MLYTAIISFSLFGFLVTVESETNFRSRSECLNFITRKLESIPSDLLEQTQLGVYDMRCQHIPFPYNKPVKMEYENDD